MWLLIFRMASIPTEGPVSGVVPIPDEDMLDLLLKKSIAQHKLKEEINELNSQTHPDNRNQQLSILKSRIKKLTKEAKKAHAIYFNAQFHPDTRGRQELKESRQKQKELDENRTLLRTLKRNWKNCPRETRSFSGGGPGW